ncbi:MAG: peptidase M23 [Maricaulis sp.]|jgi:murein DD-endopeptidase MepM/ murein hydrolase activator NlpD|nr:peptidase M23 [Maricaulis sp.]HAQ35307.1 peptidase M23 [Alphaproteobacteria bacterium]
MSGFDVKSADTARRHGIAIGASLVLSIVLLAGLLISRASEGSAAERTSEPYSPTLAELTATPTTPEGEVYERAIFREDAVFAGGCTACPAERRTVAITVPRGGTLAGVLAQAGAQSDDLNRAVYALDPIYPVRHLRAGQDMTIYLETPRMQPIATRSDEGSRLAGFSFRPESDRTITVARQADGSFRARELVASLERQIVRSQGTITSSLYVDALAAGATDRIVVELAGVLGYAVDFQRSIQPGDTFDVVYERFVSSSGETVRTGDILYVNYSGSSRPLEYYLYDPGDGPGYYNGEGESAERFLMATPINGARLSSHFGMRRHPVLGYNRMHRGTDFAAPRGTPIYAAGNGVVIRANRFGSFGNYVRIRHSNGYETAYAHLNRFASGVTAGTRVRQGQTIGYVGTTGRSTGPHLHYEVLLNNSQVNPMSLDLPTGRTLEASEIPAFEAERDRLMAIRDAAIPAAGTPQVPAARLVAQGERTHGAQ